MLQFPALFHFVGSRSQIYLQGGYTVVVANFLRTCEEVGTEEFSDSLANHVLVGQGTIILGLFSCLTICANNLHESFVARPAKWLDMGQDKMENRGEIGCQWDRTPPKVCRDHGRQLY
jgi:hypothetical protein